MIDDVRCSPVKIDVCHDHLLLCYPARRRDFIGRERLYLLDRVGRTVFKEALDEHDSLIISQLVSWTVLARLIEKVLKECFKERGRCCCCHLDICELRIGI